MSLPFGSAYAVGDEAPFFEGFEGFCEGVACVFEHGLESEFYHVGFSS